MGHAMGMFAKGPTAATATAAYWGAFVGNSLPDIDVTVGHLLGMGWSLHRKFTHTIPGVLLLSALAAGVITWAIPGSDPLLTFGWTLLGAVVHVFMDCLNLFGTRPLWPFSNRVFGLGVVFLLDPVILATLGLGSVAQLAGWMPAGMLRWLYMAIWVYLALRWLVLSRLRARLPGGTFSPWFLGWRFFRQAEGRLELGKAGPLGRRLIVLETVESARGPAVDASRQIPAVAAFLQRARFPVARLEQKAGRYRVTWEDVFMRLRGRRQGLEVWLDTEFRPIG